MIKVRGTQNIVKPVTVNVDTVYLRTDITKVKEEDFEGWEYNEEQLSKDEYLSKLASEDELGGISTVVAMLMMEIDILKAEITMMKGGVL